MPQICAKIYSNFRNVIKGAEGKKGGARKFNPTTVTSSRVMPLNKN